MGGHHLLLCRSAGYAIVSQQGELISEVSSGPRTRVSSNGAWAEVTGDDKVVQIFDCRGELPVVVARHDLGIRISGAAWHPTLPLLYLASQTELFRVDLERVTYLGGRATRIHPLCVFEDGRLAVGAEEREVAILDADGKELWTMETTTQARKLAPRGRLLAIGEVGGSVSVWET